MKCVRCDQRIRVKVPIGGLCGPCERRARPKPKLITSFDHRPAVPPGAMPPPQTVRIGREVFDIAWPRLDARIDGVIGGRVV